MEIVVTDGTDNITRVALVGSLDLVGVGQIETKFTAFTAGRGLPTIVDLSKLTFISSLGMGVLITCYKGLKRKNAKIVLLQPQPLVKQVLDVAGITQLIPVAQTEEEALKLLAA